MERDQNIKPIRVPVEIVLEGQHVHSLITKDGVARVIDQMRELQDVYPVKHIIATAYQNIGAGHVVHGHHLASWFDKAQIPFGTVSLDLNAWTTNVYGNTQKHRKTAEFLEWLVKNPIPTRVIDWQTKKFQELSALDHWLRSAHQSHPDDFGIPLLFHTTYVASAVVVRRVLNQIYDRTGVIVGGLNEYVSDPWVDKGLVTMTTPKAENDPFPHTVVVFDKTSASSYEAIRGNSVSLYPYGIHSNVAFYEGDIKPRQETDPFHVWFELSGNPNPAKCAEICAFIRYHADQIRNGTLEVSAHVMHHKELYELLCGTVRELGLENTTGLHLIVEKSLHEAVITREKGRQGKLGFPTPSIVVNTGGGEVALETNFCVAPEIIDGKTTDRYIARVHPRASWGGHGHEDNNIKAGTDRQGHIDARNIPPSQLLKFLQTQISLLPQRTTVLQNSPILASMEAQKRLADQITANPEELKKAWKTFFSSID